MTAGGARSVDGPEETVRIAKLPMTVLAITIALLAAMVPLSLGQEELTDTVFYGLLCLTLATTGALVASRQPRNPIGWIFSAQGLWGAVVEVWEAFAYHSLPTAAAGQWFVGWSWVVDLAAYVVTFLLFPTGRLPTRRWRGVGWLIAVSLVLGIPGQAFNADNPDNPLGIDSGVVQMMFVAGMVLLMAAMVAALASLVIRFRRASGVERQQLKQLMFAAVILLPIWLIAIPFYYDSVLLQAVVGMAFLALPIAIGLAILRYRLYDIDLVISKTLLVAGLAGFITATYVGIVVGIGSLVGRGDDPNLVLSIAATAFVAVAFQPVRRRLQRLANRLVFGRRATPYDVLSGFATRVGAAEATAGTLVGLAELMADGTGAQPARVWLRVGSQLRPAATWPVERDGTNQSVIVHGDAAPALPDADLAVPVREQDELLGVLTIAKPRGERVTEVDVDLVERLASASGVLLRNLRLDAELAQRLDEIEVSRRRLVSAQDDARRRIEAELGGGTRERLRALRDQLAVLRSDLDEGSAPKTAMLLDQLMSATDSALDTLEGLAAGVYPPRLAADGLVAALTEQAGRAAVRVEVNATGVGRYPPEVEAAVYFAALEALQNVAKYADAGLARIRLADEPGRLVFEVTDDGAGFDSDTVTLGTGLQGIVDRLDTVNGTVTITSHPGSGTTVAGSVPITERAEHEAAPALTGAHR
jgi:signal transduction histidine kinase